MVHFFPALDKVAKLRRPKDSVGARIRGFLKDEEVLISEIATRNAFSGVVIDGLTFEEAIYKFGRTPIAHEGELDPRLRLVNGGNWSIGEVWILPSQYILGLCVVVMVAPECKGEGIDGNARVTLFDREWELNRLWGAEQEVKAHVAATFQNPNLF